MQWLPGTLIVVASIAVALGIVIILARSDPAPPSAAAAGIEVDAELPEQFAVMIELAPTFLAIQRVQLLNLVNGLFLSDEQLDEIIAHLSELERLQKELADMRPKLRRHAEELAQTRRLLAELETVLAAREQPAPDLAAEVNRVTTRLFTAFGDFGRLDEQIKSFQAQTHGAIYDLLTENQRILVQEYVECLIPPEGDPMNPQRIGQAKQGMSEQLEELRAMAEPQYALARDHLVEELWQFILTHCPDEQQGAAAERQRLAKALDQIRGMDATEFALLGEERESLLLPYDVNHVKSFDGALDETLVRERIYKFFIENNHVDLLIRYREQR